MKQLLIILLFCPLLCFSQKALEKELDSVSTKKEAKTFAKTHKKTNKMSESEINAKRTKIVLQFKQGYKFEALAKLHSMNSGAKRGGDLGWFPEGKMHPDFEEAIKSHDTNDIFTLDITDQKWHYVVLKTHDAKPIEEITVLKYTEVIK